jgi:hypothetical protein
MRNSLLPLVMVLVISAAALALIFHGDPAMPGQGGPEIDPGIFVPAKNAVYQVKTMPMTVTQSVSGDGTGTPLDARLFTVVQGLDYNPLTSATMLGLAEGITHRGGVAIFDPMRGPDADTSPPLPLGSAYVLRVETLAGKAPTNVDEACSATIRITVHNLRLPAGHPGARWQPDGEEVSRTATITRQCQAGRELSWPQWYATVGRGVAEAVITRWYEVPTRPAPHPVDWQSLLPMPPQANPVRWAGAFQDELVRGWIGRIDGTTVGTADGRGESALAPLERRLSTKWTEQAAHGAMRIWKHNPPDSAWFSVTATADPVGWDLAYWTERDDPVSWYQGWIAAAGKGDANALAILARHRDCPGASADLRDAAALVLAQHGGSATAPVTADASASASSSASVSASESAATSGMVAP